MSERDQMLHVCQQNRELARENSRLKEKLRRLEHECQELGDANANLRAEVDAADVVLGSRMDELLGKGRR
jgi:predicted nuclease with TOPRIM domain